MKIIQFLLLTSIILFFSGCNLKQTTRQDFNLPGSDSPQAWIDAPLPGAHLPLAPYEFVSHGTDQAGINQLEWILNGLPLGITNAANPSEKLATFRNLWTPTVPGTYTLQVRAKNNANIWSSFDEAIFTVGDLIITNTATLIITNTPTPVITITPTLIITDTPTPIPPSTEIKFSPTKSINQFFFGACQPNQVDMSVQLSNTNSVKHVEIYINLLDMNSSDSSGWNSYAVMSDKGSGLFGTTVKANGIQGANRFSSMTVLYQFIVFGTNGSVIARSTSYNDLTLVACDTSIIPILPVVPIIPIIPPGRPTLIPPPK